MKLINADLLEKQMNKEVLHLFNSMYTGYVKAMKCVKQQPTAFDVDKAISELERDKFIESECILSDVHQGYNAGLSRAIEIVKGGGVDGN